MILIADTVQPSEQRLLRQIRPRLADAVQPELGADGQGTPAAGAPRHGRQAGQRRQRQQADCAQARRPGRGAWRGRRRRQRVHRCKRGLDWRVCKAPDRVRQGQAPPACAPECRRRVAARLRGGWWAHARSKRLFRLGACLARRRRRQPCGPARAPARLERLTAGPGRARRARAQHGRHQKYAAQGGQVGASGAAGLQRLAGRRRGRQRVAAGRQLRLARLGRARCRGSCATVMGVRAPTHPGLQRRASRAAWLRMWGTCTCGAAATARAARLHETPPGGRVASD